MDRREKIVNLLQFALIAPKSGHAHRRTQFPRLYLLLTRDGECTLEIRLSFGGIRLGRDQRDFPGDSMDISLAPPFVRCFNQRYRFINGAPSVMEVSKFSMRVCQVRQKEKQSHR
jgi:hypothetical protein